jgi:hypothetical protein
MGLSKTSSDVQTVWDDIFRKPAGLTRCMAASRIVLSQAQHRAKDSSHWCLMKVLTSHRFASPRVDCLKKWQADRCCHFAPGVRDEQ